MSEITNNVIPIDNFTPQVKDARPEPKSSGNINNAFKRALDDSKAEPKGSESTAANDEDNAGLDQIGGSRGPNFEFDIPFGSTQDGSELNQIIGDGVTQISSYDDDPFVSPSVVESLPDNAFFRDENGVPVGLEGPTVRITESDIVSLLDEQTFRFDPLAVNPWSTPQADENGDFIFQNDERFPTLQRETDALGNVQTDENGLQVWTPSDDHLGQTTAFESIYQAIDSSSEWMGRDIPVGNGGQITVEPHEFVGGNAFYDPTDRGLHFGMVPYRNEGSDDIKLFEIASSFDVAAHEAGHGIHDALKPNVAPVDPGYRMWGESFGDSLAMWTSLEDTDRAQGILDATGGDMSRDNVLANLAEGFGQTLGIGNSLRNALNDQTMDTVPSDPNAFHARSQVLTGATYDVFSDIFNEKTAQGEDQLSAIQSAGDLMGAVLTRATEHTPEVSMTFQDVAKGYLTASELHADGGAHTDKFIDAFLERGLLSQQDVEDWKNERANLPQIDLGDNSDFGVDQFINENMEQIAGKGFNATVQEINRGDDGSTSVRFNLSAEGAELKNSGMMVFDKDGQLQDIQRGLDEGITQDDAMRVIAEAKDKGLDQFGPIELLMTEEGELSARVVEEMTGSDPHLMVHDLKSPEGERAEYSHREHVKHQNEDQSWLKDLLPPGAEVLSADEFMNKR